MKAVNKYKSKSSNFLLDQQLGEILELINEPELCMTPAILHRKEVGEWLAKRGAQVILRRNVEQSSGKRCVLSLQKSVSIIIVVYRSSVRPSVRRAGVCVRACCVRTIIPPLIIIPFGFSYWLEPPVAS